MPQTIRKGSSGDDVKRWQGIVGASPVDGIFGPATESKTKAWQASKNLVPDGVVGPATWALALGGKADKSVPVTTDPNNIHVRVKRIVDSLGLTHNQSMFVRMVAWHETNYGQGWKEGKGKGSNNMGAITTPGGKQTSPLDFAHNDSRNDTGKIITYTTYFKGYPTPEDGFAHLAKFVLKDNVKAGLKKGDIPAAVMGMYANRYFLGIHPRNTEAGNKANVKDYTNALLRAYNSIVAKTGEKIDKSVLQRLKQWLGLG